MKENHLEVKRSARYFTIGDLNYDTKRLLFVLHGYGQNVKALSMYLNDLELEDTFVIVPEGLSRFYFNGFEGDVGASWMTKESRLHEISDYVHYLNTLYDHMFFTHNIEKCHITVLGFSQGVATQCRWVDGNPRRFDHLILWAGRPAHDVKFVNNPSFTQAELSIVIGDNDPFINEKDVQILDESLTKMGLKHTLHRFKGKHHLHTGTLREVLN